MHTYHRRVSPHEKVKHQAMIHGDTESTETAATLSTPAGESARRGGREHRDRDLRILYEKRAEHQEENRNDKLLFSSPIVN